ncbi:MAG TPA: BON domain-containing protein [Planctomycetaceae bacterium]|nr:BON domain-containing protein [Planctomycetaceae bacterium]
MSNSALILSVHDLAVEQRVLHYLLSKNSSAARRVEIDVAEGEVTLRGQVKSFYTRQVFVQGCRRVPGVTMVVDELRVEA